MNGEKANTSAKTCFNPVEWIANIGEKIEQGPPINMLKKIYRKSV